MRLLATARCRTCSTTSTASPGCVRMRSNVYSRLLTGLLLGDDVPLRLAASELPPRLRTGPAAAAERLGTDLILGAPGIARRLRERRSAGDGSQGRDRAVSRSAGDHGRDDRLDRPRLSRVRARPRASRPRARGHGRELRTLARRRRGTRARLHRSRGADRASRESAGAGAQTSVAEAARRLEPTLARLRPDVVVSDLFTLAPALAAEVAGVPAGVADPTPLPGARAGPAVLPARAAAAAYADRPPRLAGALARRRHPAAEHPPARASGPRSTSRAAELGLGPQARYDGQISEQLALVATFPQLEYPRRWPAHVHVTGPMPFELEHPEIELPPRRRSARARRLEHRARPALGAGAHGARGARARAGAGRGDDQPHRRRLGRRRPTNAIVVDWFSYSSAAGAGSRWSSVTAATARSPGRSAAGRPGARLPAGRRHGRERSPRRLVGRGADAARPAAGRDGRCDCSARTLLAEESLRVAGARARRLGTRQRRRRDGGRTLVERACGGRGEARMRVMVGAIGIAGPRLPAIALIERAARTRARGPLPRLRALARDGRGPRASRFAGGEDQIVSGAAPRAPSRAWPRPRVRSPSRSPSSARTSSSATGSPCPRRWPPRSPRSRE